VAKAAKPTPTLTSAAVRPGGEFFGRPTGPNHRRYEALRGYLYEGLPIETAAARSGDAAATLRSAVRDFRAGKALHEGLTQLAPGSVLVGEEGVGQDPNVLAHLGGADPVWIVDPIDGTENFIAGRQQFSTLVALAYRGELLASWLHAPLGGLTARRLLATGRRSTDDRTI